MTEAEGGQRGILTCQGTELVGEIEEISFDCSTRIEVAASVDSLPSPRPPIQGEVHRVYYSPNKEGMIALNQVVNQVMALKFGKVIDDGLPASYCEDFPWPYEKDGSPNQEYVVEVALLTPQPCMTRACQSTSQAYSSQERWTL